VKANNWTVGWIIGGLGMMAVVAFAQNPLPNQLERTVLEMAKRNPFIAFIPSPPPVVVKKAPPSSVVQAPVAPPMAPPLNLRYVGRVIEPDGKRVVFASLNDAPLTLTAGQLLSNGYRVDAIKDDVVELTYPPLNTTARFDIPRPPTFDIR
jgi:hypothetical protein